MLFIILCCCTVKQNSDILFPFNRLKLKNAILIITKTRKIKNCSHNTKDFYNLKILLTMNNTNNKIVFEKICY